MPYPCLFMYLPECPSLVDKGNQQGYGLAKKGHRYGVNGSLFK